MGEKEERILAAAFRLIHRHGYRKVTMSDVAEAAEMSRPSLYASFSNKEAILSALIETQSERYGVETRRELERRHTLKTRLEAVFEIWIVQPVASVIDSENGAELLANCARYVPDAVAELYRRFEAELLGVLKPAMTRTSKMTAHDLAHIMALATRGLKASTETLPELRRLIGGLIAMAIATK